MKLRLVTTICTIASAMMAAAQVPSLINYQGRLTDAAGAPVTGSKNFSISLYDAATAGNLLYTESIGAVTLDANGVYSFQFGATGTSNSQATETLATTDTATLVYTKALANTGIVENSITVTDGTNTWSQSVGNPGVGATATANTIAGFVIGATITNGGSGYTTPPVVTIIGNGSGATATAVLTEGVVTGITITSAGSGYTGNPIITIAPPVIPFRVDYNSGIITATYSAGPTAGRAVTASYRYATNGITGALTSGTEHWMAVSVDGLTHGTRQRVLAAPFAMRAQVASTAENLAPQLRSWRPEVFSTSTGSTTTPFGWSIHNSGVNADSVISTNFISFKNISFSYSMGRGYYSNGTAEMTVRIIKIGLDASEQIVFDNIVKMTATDPAPTGIINKDIPINLNTESDSYYKLRISMGTTNGASVVLHRIRIFGLEPF